MPFLESLGIDILSQYTMLAFTAMFLFACLLIKNGIVRAFVATIGAVFIVAQIFSLYSTQTFIGYQFYIHANIRDVDGMQGIFLKQILVFGCLTVVLWVVYFFSYRVVQWMLRRANRWERFAAMEMCALLLVVMCGLVVLRGNFVRDTKTLLPLFASKHSDDFRAVLERYGMGDYVSPEHIEAIADGRNVIVISMESMEKNILLCPDSLTPNLNRLKNEWHTIDIYPNEGSSWTSGSLYTSLTGFPAEFGIGGNQVFHTAVHSNISSIVDAFRKNDYRTIFIIGNAEFSGTRNILTTFHFDEIVDYLWAPDTFDVSALGLHDRDLFSLAKIKVEEQLSRGKPFFMFISTTDSHFPDGIIDPKMQGVVAPRNNGFDFCVSVLDYVVGDFIDYLRRRRVIDNTTIFLYPDHLKMGTPPSCGDPNDRRLYVISNSVSLPKPQKRLYQIDIPHIILQGAGVRHNLRFLTDYIADDDKSRWIEQHLTPLTEINTSGIVRDSNILVEGDSVTSTRGAIVR